MKYKNQYCWIITLFFILVMVPLKSFSQSYYGPIDSIISRVTLNSIVKTVKEMCGDTIVTIGRNQYRLRNRSYNQPENQLAAQYIYERFQSYGLNVRYQQYSTTGANIIAKKTGTKYPNRYYIIGAHFDTFPFDTLAPGADDNATGVAAVLEAAKLLQNYSFDYTLIFAAWDEEESGLYGSKNYADSAFIRGDSILAYINLDMIAYNLNNNNMTIYTNNSSMFYADLYYDVISYFKPELHPAKLVESAASDIISFWQKGFKGIYPFEEDGAENPFINSVHDSMIYFNYPYFLKMAQAVIAGFAFLAFDNVIYFTHQPVASSGSTSDITVYVLIKSKMILAAGTNSPKLYYKIGSSQFTMLNASYHNLDTFKFIIPGQPLGSTIPYYFAAQDSMGKFMGSLPQGARGVNPPGSIPPPALFTYHVVRQLNTCSNTTPKTIIPGQVMLDTIRITQSGNINDCNLNLTINHTNDSDLYIYLIHPGYGTLLMSGHNGGTGDNYINTTFDDEATIPITQGTPPFTGSFKPENALSGYKTKPVQGDWILRVYNNSQTVTGQLVNWCLGFEYYDPIGIVNNQIPLSSRLLQNYPNPFNPFTKIDFAVMKESFIKIILYDVLGREVRTLINDKINSGRYSVKFDGSNLASGMYFYSMYVDGILLNTKKMILIK